MTRPPYGGTVVGNDWRPALTTAPATDGVSVVVLHYEQHAQLARTLHALARQTHPADRLEIVVVDDGSAQPPQVPDGVRLILRADTGFTAAAARNQGVAATTQPVLVLLDADTVPEPGFVEAITRLPARLPEAVVVGRRRHADLAGADLAAPVERLGPERLLPEPGWLADGYRATDDLLRADATSYRYVISSVLACSRWLFDELGGFDESLQEYGGEDWEWAWRAWQHGAVLAHEPAAVAWHDGPDWAGRNADRGAARQRKDAETLRLAERMAAPTAALKGLRLGPAELVVTLSDDLSSTELVITVDGLLAAVPTALVAATPEQRALLGRDARVLAREPHHDVPHSPELQPHALRLHLEAGVHAGAEPWRGLVAQGRAGDHPTTLEVTDEHGPLARLEVLRAHRRAARWERSDLFEHRTADAGAAGLRRLTEADRLEAHVGGWL